MGNKKVLALHFRESLFASPDRPVFVNEANDQLKFKIKSALYFFGLGALAFVSLSMW